MKGRQMIWTNQNTQEHGGERNIARLSLRSQTEPAKSEQTCKVAAFQTTTISLQAFIDNCSFSTHHCGEQNNFQT